MKVSSISSANNNTFKGGSLILHGNSRQIITQGDKAIAKHIKDVSKQIKESSKDYDLHAVPNTSESVSFYWTKHKSKKPVMEAQHTPFTRVILHHDNSVKKAVGYITDKQAEDTYRMLNKPNETLVQKFDTAAKITLNLGK